VQGLIEHFADVLPTLAALGPPLVLVAIGLLGVHYWYAYQKMQDKKMAVAGFVGYLVILVLFKGLELGFPKDSGPEQIVALEDELYSAHHVILHMCLVANLAVTALNVPSPLASSSGVKSA